MNRLLGFLIAVFALTALTYDARAQLTVQMKPTKNTFVAYEPVKVTVTITNRAGRDVVLAGRGKAPWLSFQVTDNQGNLVSPRNRTQFQPVIVPAGQSLKRTITVNSMYSMSRKRIYRIKASVYFTQLDQFFNSRPETVQVADGKELWHQVLGVPDGNEGAGTYRRFSLLIFHTGAEKELYLRVQDEQTGAVLTTYSLGQVIMIRDPQWTIDRENRLHILHMGAPQAYAHSVIGIDGMMVARDVYREKAGDRPKMIPTPEGDVIVVGGASESDKTKSPLSEKVRKLSERPPGFPKIDAKGLAR